MITQARLKELLHYDSETGVWTWLVSRGGREAGSVAGHHAERRRIKIESRLYLAHRLAFLYMTGEWPTAEVDHKDTNPRNGRWSNLRPATDVENAHNCRRRADNSSGFKGVHWHKASGKWAAEIRCEGKRTHLGLFDCPEKAHRVYSQAAVQLHGDFACVG